MNIEIQRDPEEKSRVCARILRALPDWFGIEDAVRKYTHDVRMLQTWLAVESGEAVGFLSTNRHFPTSAEIHVMGVLPEYHGRKIGSFLLAAAEQDLRADGARMLTVKTLSSSRTDPNYARTRKFYEARGFLPLEEFPSLWGPHNPCLFLAKSLET